MIVVSLFAQELNKLFHKAYFNLIRGGTEVEAMGQSVLANQFISGLQPVLKSKVVGTEGNLERLLAKARLKKQNFMSYQVVILRRLHQ